MATIALALGTSHSPMLSTGAELWAARLDGDRSKYASRWDDLVAANADAPAGNLDAERWRAQDAVVQAAIDELAASLRAADVDTIVIVGDDQEEVFPRGVLPPFAVWCADAAVDDPPDPATLPDFRVASLWAFHGEQRTSYPCHPSLAAYLVDEFTRGGFDVASVVASPAERHLGHAFTFVQRRIVREPWLPMVPVLLNTFFPRSQPTVLRAHEFGTCLGQAIAAWPGDERIALVASGGLSHHLVDEAFDRRLLSALGSPSGARVRTFSDPMFTDGDAPCGTGESKNWIVVAAAARGAGLTMDLVAYEPLYRTPAGTGVGAAFARWSRG